MNIIAKKIGTYRTYPIFEDRWVDYDGTPIVQYFSIDGQDPFGFVPSRQRMEQIIDESFEYQDYE